MKVIRDVRAISKLLFVLLLLAALIVGAVLSYLWILGYYVSLGLRVPEKTTVSITDVTFNPQDTSYFNVTILNPSYSPADALITRIAALTRNGEVHNVTETDTPLPYSLPKAAEKQFRGVWNWADYTGETVTIVAYVADGSGPAFEAKTPLVDLEVTDAVFNSTISVTYFNVTVQNSAASVTYVNITDVTIDGQAIPAQNLSTPLPRSLVPNESLRIKSTWNWAGYQNRSVTVAVHTLQGYEASIIRSTPRPVTLSITNVLFNVTDTTRFDVTVQNSADSPTYVNITGITVTVGNATISAPVVPPQSLPHALNSGHSVTFRCSWNWTGYRERSVTITVNTLQGFKASSTQTTTAQVLLDVTNVTFDVADPTYFNVTVRSSEFSLKSVNITLVTVTVKNVTSKDIEVEPPRPLNANASVMLTSLWNWSSYWKKEVSITVYADGYSADYTTFTPSPITLSDIAFNLNDTTHFNVTVRNSEFFSTYVLITRITAKLENGTVQTVTLAPPARLPYVLHQNESVAFVCSWNWAAYSGQTIAIKVETLEGYEVTAPDVSLP